MSTLITFVVIGIVSGSVYSLAGVGLVLTFKTSGIFNFAQGALGTLAAYLFFTMHVQHHLAWPLAAAITIVLIGALVGVIFESFGRGLSKVSIIWQIASMIGILISLEALFTIIYGVTPRDFTHFLPTSGFVVDQVHVSYEDVVVVAVSFVSTAVLYASFRLTRTGMAMRAVVEGPDLLALARTNPNVVRRTAWIIGCSFAMMSGLLIAPNVTLDPTTLTLLIFQAFGAAAIGRFSSVPMTWVGGLVLGIGASLLTKYGPSGSLLSALAPTLPIIILVVVLVLARSRLQDRNLVTFVRPISWSAPGRVQVAIGVAVLAVLAIIPQLVGYQLVTYTSMLTSVLLFMSLGLLVRLAGQASLCQVSFAAIGAVAFSKLAHGPHIPWLPALLLGALIAVPIGALLTIPAVRVSGLYLALVTLGFGLALQDMFYNTSVMFGENDSSLPMAQPHLPWIHLDTDTGFYYLVLLITTLVAIGMVALTRTRLGRLLRGVSESPISMRSAGHGIEVALILVFSISAFVAALSGELQGMVYHQVGAGNYDPILSFVYFAVALISVGVEPWYALVPAAGLTLLPLYITNANTFNYLQLTFGVAAVSIALAKQPQSQRLTKALHRFFDRFAREPAYARIESIVSRAGPEPPARPAATNLEIRDLTVTFGGLRAVQGMTLRAPACQITGLIGPNGAGKTTILNVCSGFVTPASGQIALGGVDLRALGTAGRARQGVGRTFQLMELCDSLSVWENVVIAREAALAGASVVRQVVGRRGERETVEHAVSGAIARCGLSSVAGLQVGRLSSSERRFVELARCLAGSFGTLLLDEPSSGLDRVATQRLGEILRRIVNEDGTGILLVEHDMSLVMSVCDYIYVMDFGTSIFEGEPAAVQESAVVRSAYLGGGGTPQAAM